MSAVEITCTPGNGILTLSADTIAALDHLGTLLPRNTPWQIDVAVGWTAADTIHLTARPAPPDQPEEDAA